MELKFLVALCICICFWLAEGCNRENANNCKDDSSCRISTTDHAGRRRRSLYMKGAKFDITISGDPCSFDTYDLDRDGVITGAELLAVLDIKQDTIALLAKMTGGEKLDMLPDEFYKIAPRIITECDHSKM